jgi:hypothetical protein
VRFRGIEGQKIVAILGDFSPKKANFRILWELLKVIKNMKYFFSLGWEPGFRRTGTCQ